MPNQRRDGQTFLGLQVDDKLAQAIEEARRYTDKSQFVREAIADKLKGLGYSIPEDWVHPPQRTGKGGKSATYPKTKSKSPPKKKI